MFRALSLVVVILLVVAGAWAGRPNQRFLAAQLIRDRLEPVLSKVAGTKDEPRVRIALRVRPEASTDTDAGEVVASALANETAGRIEWVPADAPPPEPDHRLHLNLLTSQHGVTLRFALDDQPEQAQWITWCAVLPPLLAIVTAILFRRVILSLALGVLAGGVIAVWPAGHLPLYGIWHAFHAYLIRHALLDEFRLEIIAFVILLSATVGLAQRSGGIQATIDIVARLCRTARAARLGTALAGLLLFFDDYLNCIVVGNTLRPLTDRHGVSRAKLAYIVDSTAAPLAGLAVFSTWIAFEVSQITEGLAAANLAVEPFSVFVQALPTRFYCVFTLVLVFALAWLGRDYGPMLAAERLAGRRGESGSAPDTATVPARPPQARYATLPIGVTLASMILALWWSGWTGAGRPSPAAAGVFAWLRAVLAHADSMWAFSRASGLGFVLAVVMLLGARRMTVGQVVLASLASVRVILRALVILFLAWSLGAACRDVGTAAYLVALFREVVSPVGFAVVVFCLSCLVSFSTGSSFSTMAILLPNVVPLAFDLGQHSSMTGMALVTLAIGAVMDGAIFGDHCSPISDTTILSAMSSRCETIEHVHTQMPYALTAMAVALVIGYIPASLGVPPWLSWACGGACLVAIARLVGRRIDDHTGGAGAN